MTLLRVAVPECRSRYNIRLSNEGTYVYSAVSTAQSALHFTPRQTCSFQRQLDISGKHLATLQSLCEDYSFTYPPLSIAGYTLIQLGELKQSGTNEIAQASKRPKNYLKPGFLYS